jgi:hypothetical protein
VVIARLGVRRPSLGLSTGAGGPLGRIRPGLVRRPHCLRPRLGLRPLLKSHNACWQDDDPSPADGRERDPLAARLLLSEALLYLGEVLAYFDRSSPLQPYPRRHEPMLDGLRHGRQATTDSTLCSHRQDPGAVER